MSTEANIDQQMQLEIEPLKARFPNTQELYREVCVLLFFRYGITPTANKLYQLVRRGSMSAPAEALGKFWTDLREKSRVRLEHPDLPNDLKVLAGDLVSTLWTKAQCLAQESLADLRTEAQAAVETAESHQRESEAVLQVARRELTDTLADLASTAQKVRDLEQSLAGEVATRQSLEAQLNSAQRTITEHQRAIDDARKDFASELEKLREALQMTEERHHSAETRALLEIDRERTIAAKAQKDLEAARATLNQMTERHLAELRSLNEDAGNQKKRLGHLEGELSAIAVAKGQLAKEISLEREKTQDLAARLVSATQTAEEWHQKAIAANAELDAIRSPKKQRPRKIGGQNGKPTSGS